jgi:MoaA/NifB/PqqE/SkfB family radical SAM enzyme
MHLSAEKQERFEIHDDEWKSTLRFLWLEVTGTCNLRCTHCYADSGPEIPLLGSMSYEDWCSVLDQARALGCESIQFIGGEPVLYPRLSDLIAYSKKIGISAIEVFTNGTRLTDKHFRIFCEHEVDLAFSFYSHEPLRHDAVTLRRGSQEQTLKSIERAVTTGLKVRVGVIEMDQNNGDYADTKAMLQRIGVKSIGHDLVRGVGRGSIHHSVSDPMKALCGGCWKGQLAIDNQGLAYPCVFSKFARIGRIDEGLATLLQKQSLHSFRAEVRERSTSQAVCTPDCHPNGGCSPHDDCSPKDKPCSPDCHPNGGCAPHDRCKPNK